jgi:hypothetical protein
MNPVPLDINVAQEKRLGASKLDGGDGAGDLAGNESFAPGRAFVVEKDSV